MAEGRHSSDMRPRARFPLSGTWRVAHKLLLGFGFVILLSMVISLVSYNYVKKIDRKLRQIVSVEEPLEYAVLEMEINAGETARAVLDYVRELAPEHLEKLRDSEADFERFAAEFERLAETDEERRLGQEVAGLYEEFKVLGDEIVALADRRQGTLETFRRNAMEIDELIDEKIQKAIDTTIPGGLKKWQAAAALNKHIDKSFAAIQGYVLHPNPALRREVENTEADFERFVALYRGTKLSAEEAALLSQVERDFAEAVEAGTQIITVADRLNTQLELFEAHLEGMDALLDDQIQPLIHAETVAAADDAKASTNQAALHLLVLTLGGIGIAIAAAWVIHWSIVGPIRALVRGSEMIGDGNLDYRITIESRDEFGILAVAFNSMVEKLVRARQTVADGRAQLERKVADRTAELVGLAEDLRVARDAARTADRAKSEFLASMSHELRTPLNAIIGFSEIISTEAFGPVGSVRYREYGSDILESGQHLLGLINDILDLSKIESGVDELHEDLIEIPQIVRSALNMMEHRAEQDGIKLQLELADQLPVLRADERKLKQILVNMLSNAVKFTKTGGKVTLKAWCRKDSGHVFQIVDTGIGIAPEDIPKALSRFGQVDGDLNRQYEGTGLGLPLSKALVEIHAGVFDLQSKVGVGTTITLRFPAERIVASLDNSYSRDEENRAAS